MLSSLYFGSRLERRENDCPDGVAQSLRLEADGKTRTIRNRNEFRLGGTRVIPRRKFDGEDRAAIWSVVERHVAAETNDDLFHDAQPEPGATFQARIRAISLGEFIEDVRLECVWDAIALIPYRDEDSAVAPRNADQNPPDPAERI